MGARGNPQPEAVSGASCLWVVKYKIDRIDQEDDRVDDVKFIRTSLKPRMALVEVAVAVVDRNRNRVLALTRADIFVYKTVAYNYVRIGFL